MLPKKRFGIFILRNDGEKYLEEYVSFLLADIADNLSSLCVISLRSLDSESKEQLQALPATVFLLPPANETEPAEWRQAFLALFDPINISSYDELVFFDDSFFGPLYPFRQVFAAMEEKPVDFWGLTEHAEAPTPGNTTLDKTRLWYLDGSFLVIRSQMLKSHDFREYWKEASLPIELEELNNKNALRFSEYFAKLGYRWEAYCSTRTKDMGDLEKNTCRYHFQLYRLIADYAYPIIKKSAFTIPKDEMLRCNYSNDISNSLTYIQKHYHFDTGLIYRFLLRNFNLEDIVNSLNPGFVLPLDLAPNTAPPERRVAILAHLYYSDLFSLCKVYLDNIPGYADLYVTTDTPKKVELLEDLLREDFGERLTILLTPGRGRDLAALLVACKDIVQNYEYLCFLHDKKSPQYETQAQGEAFFDLLWKNMLGSSAYVEHIISTFEKNPCVGLLVPPLPFAGRTFRTQFDAWTSCFNGTEELLKDMGITVSLDPRKGPHALGSVFWFRFAALAPLFEKIDWQYENFPEEPMPIDGSISHSLERCFPYVAQARGYLSATVTNADFAATEIADFRYMMREAAHALTQLPEENTRFFAEFLKGLRHLRYFPTVFPSDSLNGSRVSAAKAYPANESTLIKPQHLLTTLPWPLDKLRTKLASIKHIGLIRSSEFFDEDWYVKHQPDARTWPGGPAAHYMTIGWKQGVDPSFLFSNTQYLEQNTDVAAAGLCPLLHYELHGKSEGRLDTCVKEGKYEALSLRRMLKRTIGRLKCARSIHKNKKVRLLVFLHLFYKSSWVEIREYLKNLYLYDYDLIVSYCDGYLSPQLLDSIRMFKPSALLICRENTGYDVRHFHELLKTVNLDDYDIVFKLHSKGTSRKRIFIYKQLFELRDWFLYLYEGVLGATTVHKTIATLTSDNQIGMMAAENLIIEDPPHKKELVYAYMDKWNIPIPQEYRYVAGTCFAVRANLLKPLQALEIDLDEQTDRLFSPDHALQRIYCLSVLNAGYQLAGNLVLRKTYQKQIRYSDYLYAHSTEQLYKDKRFILDAEFFYMTLDNRFMDSYEIVELPLQDLSLTYNDSARQGLGYRSRKVSIVEAAPYLYLQGDRKVYDNYCAYHQKNNLPYMTEARFLALIERIEQEGFDARYPIVADSKNNIYDGQHRACYMCHLHGPMATVPVLRINLTNLEQVMKDAQQMMERGGSSCQ
jgi:rhamnosyltransferase